MIVELHTARRRFPAADLGALIEGHGAPRVVVALMLALTRRAVARLFGPRAPDVDDLPAHIRRDIGLTADPPGRRPRDPRF
ncbi:MAG: hypothetical protein KDE06_00915 [Rhodobacteraceae bacterium]|nr:hypothetical protein [Paracoccaceae bacterium]MCB2119064.1 hypothetical protein [Paracoccaceae bacterium]MCB2122731.1 hypothetical protein [Paracoccaceae bacterium]MCB2131074.1 hypothetical protein [Paracoccaceae bacterium]MCB2140546.1 hypothetical protein [Paracoccaceae bacterium]